MPPFVKFPLWKIAAKNRPELFLLYPWKISPRAKLSSHKTNMTNKNYEERKEF